MGKVVSLPCAVIVLYFLTFGVNAMGRFSRVLFSQVHGTVLKEGKPLSGVTVRRAFNWRWGKEKGKDETITNSDGQFHFPQIERESISAFIPHEPVIGQFIYIDHEGEEYVAWETLKHDYEVNGELDGKPMNLDCELTRENGFHIRDSVNGICKLL
ncbi:hypothetical protein Q4S45_22655 [Massilia sp. R2A-15]|uniref:DUF6795 domain-containing protein n=1 Tax=Massilia sp. R2A-15 TaxID=3064278 RepID=UPI00273314D3|nr:carboxypeptidase-like regulatory domain-containing protein [Massilia sp. R2A-15]WLI89459.1 hypothetical protein Q4S45_22655 [Massilia sp. R2A-15]